MQTNENIDMKNTQKSSSLTCCLKYLLSSSSTRTKFKKYLTENFLFTSLKDGVSSYPARKSRMGMDSPVDWNEITAGHTELTSPSFHFLQTILFLQNIACCRGFTILENLEPKLSVTIRSFCQSIKLVQMAYIISWKKRWFNLSSWTLYFCTLLNNLPLFANSLSVNVLKSINLNKRSPANPHCITKNCS